MNTRKNATIELMRFVFCILVILFHCRNSIAIHMPKPFTFFSEGNIGVEFFFLVSGYLLAAHAEKTPRGKSLAGDTGRFIYGKLTTVLPWHLTVYAICLAETLILTANRGLKAGFFTVLDSLPNLFFIQATGIKGRALITPEWYVAAMLITMTAIYPLVLKYRAQFTRLVCPLIVIFSIGYMIHTQNKLGGVGRWVFHDSFPKAYLRAFAEICGGVFCYEVAKLLKRQKLSNPVKATLTAAEILCYLLPIGYTFSGLSSSYEAYAYYALAIAVTLSFSGVTLLSGKLEKPIVYRLGQLSLPLYYTQSFGFLVVLLTPFGNARVRYQLAFCLGITLLSALLLQPLTKRMNAALRKTNK